LHPWRLAGRLASLVFAGLLAQAHGKMFNVRASDSVAALAFHAFFCNFSGVKKRKRGVAEAVHFIFSARARRGYLGRIF
jgi:hypothetical protein